MKPRRRLRDALTWLVVLAVITALLIPFRANLDKAIITLVLLLVVLAAGAHGGRVVGVGIGAASLLVFDWFFLPPLRTFVIANPLDWLLLFGFLVTSLFAAQLLHREQESARIEALRESDRLKDALLASISHDLRTPLTTIKALAHELGELRDERSQIIEEQADRLNRLVTDLLDLSRLNAGVMPLHVELNAVDDLLTAALQDVETRLRGRSLVAELPTDDPMLVGRFDLALSIRVLVNLIENAVKYSSPGTAITLAVWRDGGKFFVSVSDVGPGVPAGEEERIFAPFYRPAGERPDVGSAGLGLATARRMAEWQHGAVTYARTADGSRFTLELPAADLKID